MNKDHISVCKGKELRKKAGNAAGKKAGRKKVAPEPAAAPSAVSAPPAPKRTGADGIVLDDILAVKALTERVGPGQLLTLIDALAR
jgi:hypothetical protein